MKRLQWIGLAVALVLLAVVPAAHALDDVGLREPLALLQAMTGTSASFSGNVTTAARYCTDTACTTAYLANDGFGALNLIGTVGGTGNWSTAGSLSTDTSLKIGATAVGTCNAGAEGAMRRDTVGGGTGGHRTRVCLCTSDGAGSPAYAWQNMVSGTVGTSSACAD
jgi:hypothetical protein